MSFDLDARLLNWVVVGVQLTGPFSLQLLCQFIGCLSYWLLQLGGKLIVIEQEGLLALS